jgi:hypothetical protein
MVTENRIRQVGMLNLGNTGYFEVILQTLYHCRDFREIVLQLKLTGTPRDCPATFDMIQELQNIFREWYRLEHVLPPAEDPDEQVQHETLRLVYAHINPFIGPLGHADPTKFVAALKECMHLKNSIDDPNDAHQFFTVFLRRFQTFLQMEPVAKPWRNSFQRIFVTPQTNVRRCLHCDADIYAQDPKREKHRSLLGYCFDCPIRSAADQGDPLEHDHLTPLLTEALSEGDPRFSRLHRGRCNCRPGELVPTRIFRTPVLKSLPTILTVRFVRWPLSNRNAFIQFDEYLDLSSSSDDLATHASVKYRLLSVVVHHGSSSDQGRYFSFCRTGDQWGQFWGTEVTSVSWETVKRESFGGYNEGRPSEERTNVGYMLFYQRQETEYKESVRTSKPPTTEFSTRGSLTDIALLRRLCLVSL